MSRRKDFRQSDWPIELSPRKNVEPRIVGICSTFRGSTFFRLVEIRPKVWSARGTRKNSSLFPICAKFFDRPISAQVF